MDGGERPDAAGTARTAFDALNGPVEAPDLALRRDRLARLRAAVRDSAEAIARAVDADFGGRPRVETMLGEVGPVVAHADWTARRLGRWMRPRRVRLPPGYWPAQGRVERVPLGRVGIVAPWNHPVRLALMPLVAALAGGNRAILKPSERAPRTAELLAGLLDRELADCARVVPGGAEAARAVAGLPLDGLFLTGSTATGRLVAEAAGRNLVPVTLALGGKSPAIWLADLDLRAAAESVMAGKLFSAGQTCVAPDYLLVPRTRLDEAVSALGDAARRLYPDPDGGDYAAQLREGSRERLEGLMQGHRAVPLMDPMPRPPRMGAWAVVDPDPASPLMEEELFGPVLPVLPYRTVDEAVAFANARPCPLALYVYGRDRAACEAVAARTRSGGALVNDSIVHVAAHTLPFGGVGESGMGAYHGEEGFRSFTRPRGIMVAPRWMPARLARPPYGARARWIVGRTLR